MLQYNVLYTTEHAAVQCALYNRMVAVLERWPDFRLPAKSPNSGHRADGEAGGVGAAAQGDAGGGGGGGGGGSQGAPLREGPRRGAGEAK
eukprot:9504060-Pyramimonas_sp.AAC.1